MPSPSQKVTELQIAVAATFTAEPVEKAISFWLEHLDTPHTVQFSPYNQVFQQLLDPNSLFSRNQNTTPDAASSRQALNIIYLRLEDWLSGTESTQQSLQPMLRQNAEDLVNAVKVACLRGTAQHILVFCPTSATSKNKPDLDEAISKTEMYIVARLQHTRHIETITQAQVLGPYPLTDYDDQHTARAGHVPYTDACYAALATATLRRFIAISRAPHKVIVLDCDNTLWDGVCGEAGAAGVTISSGFKALQRFMLAQQGAGMLLCLASKNIESDVYAVFDQNEGMLLSRQDIVAAKINWQPKSENIKSLAEELNLGLDSFIFLDDNPIECAEMRANCPEVATLQLPGAAEIQQFLDHVWIFDKVNITEEDKKRAERYQQNARREQAKREVEKNASTSLKDFLTSLKLSIRITEPAKADFARAAQLTQRTNQFNTTTIRRSEGDVADLIQQKSLKAAIVQVSDRFGDYGQVGLLLYAFTDESLQVDTLILSCRALGRGVEQAMARFLAEEARAQNINSIQIAYSPSERNEPVHAFLESVATHSKSEFAQDTAYHYKTADLLKLVPFEAATPSLASNGSARKSSAAKVQETASRLHNQPAMLWQTIASQLNDAAAINQQAVSRTVPRPGLQTPYIEPQSEDEKAVAQIWQDVLGIKGVGLEDGFKELGGSSLQLVQIYGRLRAQFDLDLPFTKLFGLPTIRAFIDHLGASPDTDDKAQAIQQRAARQKAAMLDRKKLQLKKITI